MIPYFQIPSLPIFDSIAIHPFGVLVATGILVGATLTIRRGRKLGLEEEMVKGMIFWSVFTGFIFAHVLDVLLYQKHPDTKALLQAIIDVRSGLSSMAGFFGAVVGMFAWCRVNKQPVLPYADSLAYGLATGWMFGRMGCFVAHDHPGNLVTNEWYGFLGVDYPCDQPHCRVLPTDHRWVVTASGGSPIFPRYDMGFFEVIVAGALALFYFIAERFKPRCGFFVAAIAIYYGPVRFILDYLRVRGGEGADPRWPDNSWGLTPAQYAAVAVSLIGLILIVRVRQKTPLYPTD